MNVVPPPDCGRVIRGHRHGLSRDTPCSPFASREPCRPAAFVGYADRQLHSRRNLGEEMKRVGRLAVMAVAAVLAVAPAMAQDAIERAGELKAWREQCNDPDTDLRTAYLEAAIETGDVAVIRICVRQSLMSDDADIRNLGLRAALASVDQLLFEVTMPEEVAAAFKKAGKDEKQLNEISDWFMVRDWNSLRAGFGVEVEGAEVATGTSTWYPLANRAEMSNNYKGKAAVIGDQVNWTGSMALANTDCSMNLKLSDTGTLDGVLRCSRNVPFPVSASLM